MSEITPFIPYDYYGQWALKLRDSLLEKLQDHLERLVGIWVKDIYLVSNTNDSNSELHILRGKYDSLQRELDEVLSRLDFERQASLYLKENYLPELTIEHAQDTMLIMNLRILSQSLSVATFASVLTAFNGLYNKCLLIANGQFADVIDYLHTNFPRINLRAALTITQLTYNSPAEIKLLADMTPKGVAEALKIAIDSIVQTPLRHKEALIANQAREVELKIKEQEAQSVLLDNTQKLSIEAQQAELEKQKTLLELQKQQVAVEKERLDLAKEYLELETSRIHHALDIASKMVNVLHPGVDDQTKAMLLQTLLPELLQLGNTNLELTLPSSQPFTVINSPSVPPSSPDKADSKEVSD